jgi:hypothetical protein
MLAISRWHILASTCRDLLAMNQPRPQQQQQGPYPSGHHHRQPLVYTPSRRCYRLGLPNRTCRLCSCEVRRQRLPQTPIRTWGYHQAISYLFDIKTAHHTVLFCPIKLKHKWYLYFMFLANPSRANLSPGPQRVLSCLCGQYCPAFSSNLQQTQELIHPSYRKIRDNQFSPGSKGMALPLKTRTLERSEPQPEIVFSLPPCQSARPSRIDGLG